MTSLRAIARIGLFGIISLSWGWTSAQGDFLTTLTVDVSPEASNLFLYNYTLSNHNDSDLPAAAFSLDIAAQADLQSITGRAGWDIFYSARDTLISWESSAASFDLPPGFNDVFSFVSPLGPMLTDYLVVGLDETTFEIQTNQGQIAGPMTSAVPEPSALLLCGIGFLGLLGYVAWSRHRSWRRHKRVVMSFSPARPAW
jgi:hypothetical protein